MHTFTHIIIHTNDIIKKNSKRQHHAHTRARTDTI